ncbi:unannotated protein [freshwater metagenome]|uniref:Unannotated protein n=1 Tax=freshwater metagenome TaxID=449393 RepID=A0A6J6C4H8_9ZZZZ
MPIGSQRTRRCGERAVVATIATQPREGNKDFLRIRDGAGPSRFTQTGIADATGDDQ